MTTQTIQIAIEATPERVWTALTDGNITPAHDIGFTVDDGDLVAGTDHRYSWRR